MTKKFKFKFRARSREEAELKSSMADFFVSSPYLTDKQKRKRLKELY